MRKILMVVLVAFLVIGGIAFIKTLVYPVQNIEKEEVAKEQEEDVIDSDIRAEKTEEADAEKEPVVLDMTDKKTEETPIATEDEEEAVNIDLEQPESDTKQPQEAVDDFEEINEDNEDNEPVEEATTSEEETPTSEEAMNGDGRMVTVNTEKVNLRREPNSEGKIIIVVREGETGILIEDDVEGWSKVEFDGITGYISSRCIDVE